MKINTLFKRTFLFVMLAASANWAFASSTYYSKCDASVATGKGKVYVSTKETDTPSYDAKSSQTQSDDHVRVHTYYLYAQAETGSTFLQWSDGNTNNPLIVNINATSIEENSPITKTYTATFGDKPAVMVKSENYSYGNTSISPVSNKVGDNVTITADANTIDGYTFSYWSKEGSDEQNKDKQYTFTITNDNSGNYIAHFTKGNVYYRFRNSETGKYISLENNAFNYNTIVESASGAAANPDGCITRMLPFLQKDIKMVNNQATNPGTIFYIKKNTDGNYDLEAQGTSLYQLTNGYYHGGNAGAIQIKGAYATIDRNSFGPYNVSVTMTVNASVAEITIGPVYFKDDNGNITVEKDVASTPAAQWYIEPVTNMNVVPLNTNIKDSQGNLWTTLYCDFPFTLGDGVLGAYELKGITKKNDGNSYAIPTQISGTTVAGATPVLLKLNPANTEWSVNLTSDEPKMSQPSSETIGLLQGSCFDDAPATGDYNTAAASDETTANSVYNRKSFAIANDQTKNRVLYAGTVSGTDYPIGFYKLASTTKYMVANKAFLDLSKATAAAKGTVYLDFDDETTGINDINAEGQQQKEDVVYDLMGRRVTNPQHGIYIRNGKKVIYK
jgi:hypothetical protein